MKKNSLGTLIWILFSTLILISLLQVTKFNNYYKEVYEYTNLQVHYKFYIIFSWLQFLVITTPYLLFTPIFYWVSCKKLNLTNIKIKKRNNLIYNIVLIISILTVLITTYAMILLIPTNYFIIFLVFSILVVNMLLSIWTYENSKKSLLK